LTDRADGIRFLERVVVERESDHAEWRFPCALWFSRVQAVDAQAIDRAAARGAHRATRSVQESHMQRRAGTHAPRSSPRLAIQPTYGELLLGNMRVRSARRCNA
jgi:hypothetical protein